MFYFLLRLPVTQTWLTQRIVNFVYRSYNVEIKVGGVDVELFKTLVLEDVYVGDQHNDTLVSLGKLKIKIADLDFEKHKAIIDDVTLKNATVGLIYYRGDTVFNFQYLIDAFASADSTAKSSGNAWQLKLNNFSFDNVDFKYRDDDDTTVWEGMDYFDIQARGAKGRISDIGISGDTILFKIKTLSAKEKSGFILSHLSTRGSISPRHMDLDSLVVQTPETYIATHLNFQYLRWQDYLDFIDKVSFKADFDKARIEMADLAYFAYGLKGIHKKIILTGKIRGRVNDFRGRNMNMIFGDDSQFTGAFDFVGLPNVDATYMNLDVQHMVSSRSDLLKLPVPPFDKQATMNIPESIGQLGKIHFKGKFTGFTSDFYAYGTFLTDLGKVSTDLAMQVDSTTHIASYKGKLKSSNFNIGKFLKISPQVGMVSMDAEVIGHGLEADKINASVNGKVGLIQVNGYDYKNANINGTFAHRVFEGHLDVADENIQMEYNGSIDLKGAEPSFNFQTAITNANLCKLKLMDTSAHAQFSGSVLVNVRGSNIDNIRGEAKVSNARYVQRGKTFDLKEINFKSSEKNGERTLKLSSEYLDATLEGKMSLVDLRNSIMTTLSAYYPSLDTDKKKRKKLPNQDLDFKVIFHKQLDLNLLFPFPLTIGANTQISSSYSSSVNKFDLKGQSPLVIYNGIRFNHWQTRAVTASNGFAFENSFDKIDLNDSLNASNCTLNAIGVGDSAVINLTWDNKTKVKNEASLHAVMHVLNGKSVSFRLRNSNMYLADSLFVINNSNELNIDSAKIVVSNFEITSGSQKCNITGAVSSDPTDKLRVELTNVNLANLNPFTKSSGFSFKGILNDVTEMSNLYKTPLFINNSEFKSVYVNNEMLGDGLITTSYKAESDMVALSGNFTRGIVPNVKFVGTYFPSRKENNLDVNLHLEAFRIEPFQPYLKDYCSNMHGQVSGMVNVKGRPGEPICEGELYVEGVKGFVIDYLNTRYSADRFKINVKPGAFSFESAMLTDMEGNKCLVRGNIFHSNFKRFQLDIDFEPKGFMVLNTTEKNNELFFGKAYATGQANIFGFVDDILISIIAKADKGTQFNIPLSNTNEVSENSFITFVKKDTLKFKKEDYKVAVKGLKLDFDIDVTPDAELKLIFDQKIGDVIRGRCDGNLKMGINSFGNFNIFGNLVVASGDYLFTLKNVINKKFEIEKGGTIKWSGDPYDADINLSAIYKTRTTIKPFFPNDSNQIYKKRYPVECKLNMTDKLLTPNIGFDIDLPSIDDKTRQDVKSYLKTEQEMNRQVFSLLLISSFVTPYQLQGQGAAATADAGLSEGAANNSTEFLSSQVSNMLSSISKDFDIGVNYRPGDQITRQELEVALSTQLFNDRVSVDGNLGVSNKTQQSTNNIVGDVNVEYKLSEDGRFRVKAFNRTNNQNLYSGITYSPYTQGVGVFYREEFNTIGELYSRYLNKFKKKEATTTTPPESK